MIVTHTNPDFDAITGVWLLKRFGGLEKEEVAFVNTGNPDQEKLNDAIAVIDTGKQLDSINLRFDHHHLPGQDANNVCAALQVYQSIKNFADIAHLKPLIDLIFAGDTGRSEANDSRNLGIHALLSGFKASFRECGEFASDNAIMEYGFDLLDILALRLKNQMKARAELEEKTVFKSQDGLVWAIRHGSQGSSFAAFEEGARLVIFEGQPVEVNGGTTYPVGIMRAGEWQEPDTGKLAEEAVLIDNDFVEINSWFKHPAGFFTGQGTPKAPVFEPTTIDISALAATISNIWIR
jgi:hypothetical protein